MYVTVNGNVLPCCIAPFTGVPYDGIILGNYLQDAVEKVWNSDRYQELRRHLYSPDPEPAWVTVNVGGPTTLTVSAGSLQAVVAAPFFASPL